MKKTVTSTLRARGKVADGSVKGGARDTVKAGKIGTPRRSSRAAVTPPRPAKILAILESQRQLGGASYPPTAARLAELAEESLPGLGKALAAKDVKARVVVSRAFKGTKPEAESTLVLLAEDAEDIARSDRLLEVQLRSAVKPGEPTAGLAQLAKGVSRALGGVFKAATAQRLEDRRMPRDIGALPGERPLFFFVADAVLPSRDAPVPALEPAPRRRPADVEGHGGRQGSDAFAERFDRAFGELDRAAGGHNYVTLGALRAALPDLPRAAFDAELAVLRSQRRYTLDPSDGRHRQMTDAELAAGIRDRNILLVYVARRSDR
jgi:hypothetical protein